MISEHAPFSDQKKKVALELGKCLVDAGLKKKWAAQQLGISEVHFSRLIKGAHPPGDELADRIAALIRKIRRFQEVG